MLGLAQWRTPSDIPSMSNERTFTRKLMQAQRCPKCGATLADCACTLPDGWLDGTWDASEAHHGPADTVPPSQS